jgi:hypothetical protein
LVVGSISVPEKENEIAEAGVAAGGWIGRAAVP